MFYDENFHFDAIKLFSSQFSPILTQQPESYDEYGLLTNGGATLFHYIMSFPYRVVASFTDDLAIQVISLRLLGIAMVAAGLFFYRRLFELIGIRRIYGNLALAIFILLPIVPFVAATISYDNMLFILTPLFFIVAIKLLKSKVLSWKNIVFFITIGCSASLVKYTFLPIFFAAFIFVSIFLLKKYKKNTVLLVMKSAKSMKRVWLVCSIIIVGIAITLFSLVYVRNIILYRSPTPSCQKVLGNERCRSSGIEIRNNSAFETRDTRPLVQAPDFVAQWSIQMIDWSVIVGARPIGGGVVAAKPLPIIYTTVFVIIFVGIGALLMAWLSLKKNIGWYFLLSMTAVLIVAVFAQNYITYQTLHAPYAIQPRYLLTAVPILVAFICVAAGYVLRNSKALKVTTIVTLALLFTQGGGVVTAILSSADGWYWQNEVVLKMNHAAKKIIDPLVKSN
jgi:hypothetical protein